MKQTLERMRSKGFEVIECDTKEQARDYLLNTVPNGASIGVSGTVSVRELDVLPALAERGCIIVAHWDAEPEDRDAVRREAHGTDIYLTSVNALTRGGELILVDGVGNRVAAVANGPERVYFVIGRNKWVDGGYGAAIARVKKDACPPNANRQNLNTPCRTGACDPVACGDGTMCRMTLALDRVPRNRTMTVLFVNETLGY
jgi:hypothetical protein